MQTQSLSFFIRIARTPQDFHAACRIRAESYGHHLPNLYRMMMEPDLLDADTSTRVLLCVDKTSGAAIGTARFQPSTGGKLLIEHSVTAPDYMREDTRAEISRLATCSGADGQARITLMKACYLLCLVTQMRWMVICARKPSLIRQYRRVGFEDLFPDGRMIPMRHVGRMDHMVMGLNIAASERGWRDEKHALAQYFFDTIHPDIQLFSTEPALPARGDARVAAIHAMSVAMSSSRPVSRVRHEVEQAISAS